MYRDTLRGSQHTGYQPRLQTTFLLSWQGSSVLPLSLCSQTSPAQGGGASPAQGELLSRLTSLLHMPQYSKSQMYQLLTKDTPSVSTHGAGPAVVRHHRPHRPQSCISPGCQEEILSPTHSPLQLHGKYPPGSLPFKGSPPTAAIKGPGWAHLPTHTWVLLDRRIGLSASSHLKFARQREKGKMECVVMVPHQTCFHAHRDGCPT